MKRISLLCLTTLFSLATWAADFSAMNDDGAILYYDVVSSNQFQYACELAVGDYEECTNIVIPNTVYNEGDGNNYTVVGIGDSALAWTSITSVTFSESTTYVGSLAFQCCWTLKDVTLNEGLTSVGEQAFDSCYGITSISLPSSLTSIGDYAFVECTALESIVIPENVTYIGEGALGACSNLTNVTLPEGITSLSDYFLNGCQSLTSIHLPNGLTSIGKGAFQDCNLNSIDIPNNVTYIGAYAFSGNAYLTAIELPDGLEYIGDYAFEQCMMVKDSPATITIPQSVTYLGAYAFYFCRCLQELTILANIDAIEMGTFYYCDYMTTVSLPNTIYRLKSQSFSACSRVTSFTSLNPEAPICDPDALGMKTNCTIYVPKGAYDAYATADEWQNFTIVELDEEGVTPPTDENRFEVDGIYYYITDAEALTCEVTYKSTSFNTYVDSVYIPESVAYNGKDYAVVGIGYSAFRSSKNLTDVTFPETITYIDTYAFYECTSLKGISIPSGVSVIGEYAFYGCSALTEITIPANVTSVETNAFGYCSNAKNLTLEDGDITLDLTSYSFGFINNEYLYLGRNVNYDISSSGNSPFYNAGGSTLKNITFGEKVTSLSKYQFYYCKALEEVTIPSTITSFGDHIFSNCSELKTVIVSEGITMLGDYMFNNCTALNKITLPEGITALGSNVFRGCIALEEVTIPSTVTSAQGAFEDCTELKDVTIREGVAEISSSMFQDCSSLVEIALPSSISKVGSYAFAYCTNLERVSFMEGENSYAVSMYAFDGCYSLASILLPTNVTSLGSSALDNCTSLKKFVFPNQTENNGSLCFSDCSALEEVMLCSQANSSISQYIPSKMFYNCESLARLYVLSNEPPMVINVDAFTSVPTETCVLYVPVGSREAYANDTYWSVFNNIVELSAPLAVTYCVGNVASSSAQINGLVAVGSIGVIEVGFEYWTEGGDVTTFVVSDNLTTTEEINYVLSGLIYDTKYTYRVYAKTASEIIYGDEVTFISSIDATMVETFEATDISGTSAVLNGKVVAPYFEIVTEKGFIYWSDDSDKTTTVSIEGDEMVYTVESLTPETTYTYRAFASTEGGTSYGEDVSFTTLEDTGINSINVNGSSEMEGIYSASGQKLNYLQKGVNILRMRDGTTKKILIK